MCKHGDMFSLQILIGRSLFLLFFVSCFISCISSFSVCFLVAGVYGKEVPPVPIPNTAVKLFRAYDTWSSRPGKIGQCRLLLIYKKGVSFETPFLCFLHLTFPQLHRCIYHIQNPRYILYRGFFILGNPNGYSLFS